MTQQKLYHYHLVVFQTLFTHKSYVKIEINDDVKVDEEEYFPVMLRFCEMMEDEMKVGYPMKILITKGTTVEMIVAHFVSEMDDKLVFDSCLSEKKVLNLFDIVLQTNDNQSLMKLLIKLK